MRQNHRIVIRSLFWLALVFSATAAFGQIDLFGFIATKLDEKYKHLTPPFDSTRLFDPGWNITPAPVSFQYSAIGNPAVLSIPVPNTNQTFVNNTPNDGTFIYDSICTGTVEHKWQITSGMTGMFVATFNPLPGIDAASPGTDTMHLTQGETVTKEKSYTQPVHAKVTVPANSTVTFQTFFDEFPLDITFNVDVKIGGSYRFEADRGDCGQQFPPRGRCTRATFVGHIGQTYKEIPNPQVQVIDDLFVVLKLQGRYTGAIGVTPGNFKCEVKATP